MVSYTPLRKLARYNFLRDDENFPPGQERAPSPAVLLILRLSSSGRYLHPTDLIPQRTGSAPVVPELDPGIEMDSALYPAKVILDVVEQVEKVLEGISWSDLHGEVGDRLRRLAVSISCLLQEPTASTRPETPSTAPQGQWSPPSVCHIRHHPHL